MLFAWAIRAILRSANGRRFAAALDLIASAVAAFSCNLETTPLRAQVKRIILVRKTYGVSLIGKNSLP